MKIKTSNNMFQTSEKIKKIELLKINIRQITSKNGELSWNDLNKSLEINSTSQSSNKLKTLNESGEIAKGRCSQEHRALVHHEDCRVCYSLSGGGTTAFNHIKKQLGNPNVQNNKSQLHRYLDLWIGNGPYDFLKLHTFDTTVEIINLLQSVYDKKSSRYEASLTYRFLPGVMASLKLNKKEKSEINVLLERNLNVVVRNFKVKEDSTFADGNVIINIICSQLLLGQISLFKKIREFMKTKEMQSPKYAGIDGKYAPIRHIINGIVELHGKYQNLFLHDLKQHQTDIIDLYASGSTEDKTFFRFLMEASEKIY